MVLLLYLAKALRRAFIDKRAAVPGTNVGFVLSIFIRRAMFVQKFGERPLPQSDNNNCFEQATLNVFRAREMVARQREVVAQLREQGFDTERLKTFLHTWNSSW